MPLEQEIKVPLISVNDTSLTVIGIPFQDNDPVKKGDIILVFETSKTTYDVIAETGGVIKYFCEEGSDYDVNTVVAGIFSDLSEIEKFPSAPKIKKTGTQLVSIPGRAINPEWKGETLFSEAALALMEKHGLSGKEFSGYDFVSKRDVEEKLGMPSAVPGNKLAKTLKEKTPATSVLPMDPAKVIAEKLSSNKKREISFLEEVQSTGLTSTINVSVDTDGIFNNLDKSLKYLKGSLLPVILYETARLLDKFKHLNAYFSGEAIAFYKDVNIGFAVDLDKGLKVLKIPLTDKKTIFEIEESIIELSGKYLDDILQFEDLSDITFTVTDLSSEGVSFFRPLVNMMNSAILGVSAIDEKLQRCTLSVTFDHRVTEGKNVAVFLKELKARLESYRTGHTDKNTDIHCFKCMKRLRDDLSDVGFAKCITPEGNEAYICQSCLKGF